MIEILTSGNGATNNFGNKTPNSTKNTEIECTGKDYLKTGTTECQRKYFPHKHGPDCDCMQLKIDAIHEHKSMKNRRFSAPPVKTVE